MPAAFAARIGIAAHRKAADYTVAKQRLAMLHVLADALLLLAMTLGGGLAAIVDVDGDARRVGPLWRDVALFAVAGVHLGAVNLPFSWYHTFRIEERFGFNRMTLGLWLADLAKGVASRWSLGLPLLVLVLWLMRVAGTLWWLWAWGAWMGFQLLILVAVSDAHRAAVQQVHADGRERRRARASRRCSRAADSAARGLYVMDGSKRSGHGNAYFTGFGKAKRIVFFDTLLARLAPDEVEAVLAHELGHYKLKHVAKRIAWSAALSLAMLALLALARARALVLRGPRHPAAAAARRDDASGRRAASCSCSRCRCSRSCCEPLSAQYSRRHEFEADAFATRHASAGRADAGAGQAVRGQRGHAHARSAAFGVLRFASAGGDPHRAHRGAGRQREPLALAA